jgi:hypothetical protein
MSVENSIVEWEVEDMAICDHEYWLFLLVLLSLTLLVLLVLPFSL